MKHIILGDVHLGRSLNIGKPAAGKNLNSRVQDQLELLDWVIGLADKEGHRHIIITGDVYQDFKPHPAIINYFMMKLKLCHSKGITVDIVGGNHDFIRSGNYVVSALDIVPTVEIEGVRVHKYPTTLQYSNFTLSFMPFRDKRMYEVETTEEALKKLKDEMDSKLTLMKDRPNVLVGHLAIEKSLTVGDEISDQSNEIFVPIDMFNGFDYVWMGHIHHYQVLNEENPHISHIGSMDRSDFSANEIDKDKFIAIFDDETSTYELIRIPTRPLIKEKVSVPADQDSTDFVINDLCLKNKKTPFKDSIFRLEIELNGQDALNVNRDKVQDYLYNNLEVHHVPNISELRMLSGLSDNEQIFDSAIDDTKADVKKWLETYKDEFENEEEKNLFLTIANRCIDKYEETQS